MARAIFWVLLGTVILAPLPFGSIYPWSFTLLAIVVGALVGLWSAHILVSGKALPVTLGMVWFPAATFALAVGWVLLQTASWTPSEWHNPTWRETSDLLKTDLAGAVSVTPYATETVAMRLLAYAGIFWLGLQYGRSTERAKQVFVAIAIAGTVYAAYGLLVEFTGSESTLWYAKEYYKDNLTSTFWYKNAYATYAGLGLIATCALLAHALGRDDYGTMGPRERLHSVLTLVFEKIWYLVVAFAALMSALLLSDSRGGFLAALLALGVLALLLRMSRNGSAPYAKTYFAALVLVGAVFVSLSGGAVFDRLADTVDGDIRTRLYEIAAEGAARYPLVGWGAGSFESVSGLFQAFEFDRRTVRAHNEYLDNAQGMGIPATVAQVACLFSIAAICFRGIRRRQRNHHYPAAGCAAVVLVGTHSMVDFTMQTPARRGHVRPDDRRLPRPVVEQPGPPRRPDGRIGRRSGRRTYLLRDL